ncbi:MAG: hypothetical protein ACE5OZ_18205 [Candidatus Heimdallarchaeota archaeon]
MDTALIWLPLIEEYVMEADRMITASANPALSGWRFPRFLGSPGLSKAMGAALTGLLETLQILTAPVEQRCQLLYDYFCTQPFRAYCGDVRYGLVEDFIQRVGLQNLPHDHLQHLCQQAPSLQAQEQIQALLTDSSFVTFTVQISQPGDRAFDEESFGALVEQFSADLWRLLDRSFNFPFSPALVHITNSMMELSRSR